ncbi:jerky protein homolog [Scylla paramamosain]|uniref:jerky protein homolog n=1 Tax=Scylla paramamosain TaxID=85552 RepID=UPI0030835CE5
MPLVVGESGGGDRSAPAITDTFSRSQCNGDLGGKPFQGGDPHGSVLAPIMFVVYINDMVENVSSYVSLFADDAKLMRRVKGTKDCEELQRDIDKVWEWSNRWQMEFNSGPMLQEKGRDLAKKMGEKGACQFSDGWLYRFKVRHSIRKLDISGESKSAKLLLAEEFVDRFAKIVEEHNLTSEQIYNADETGLFYRCLPRTTLASESEGDVKGFKQSKDRLTVLCCASMAGMHKVKLCVVGKHKKPRCFKNVNYLPVDYHNQRSAWMTAEIFFDWFKHCFVPSVKENLKKNYLPEDSKVVLLSDNCRAHPPAEELVGNVFAVYLPPNVTSVIQPMDQGVIQNFKMNFCKRFLHKLVNYEEGPIPESQKQFNVKDTIFMASLAWLDVKRQTLMRCWCKLYPLMMCDDEDDEEFEGFVDGMKNSVVSELREMGGNVQLKVTDEALQEWVDVDENQAVTFTLTDE